MHLALDVQSNGTRVHLVQTNRFSLTVLPNSSVDFVSDSLKLAGEQQMMIVVRALPPSDS